MGKQIVIFPFNEILVSIKKKLLFHALTWINHKIIFLGERGQAKKQNKQKHFIIPHV